jgi:hypothetical protein
MPPFFVLRPCYVRHVSRIVKNVLNQVTFWRIVTNISRMNEYICPVLLHKSERDALRSV